MPVLEVHDEAQNPLGDTTALVDPGELITLLTSMQHKQIYNSGVAKGHEDILQLFGITNEQFHAKMREQYSAQAESKKP